MKNTLLSFKQLLQLIINDSILIIICLSPIFFGLVVKLGVPLINEKLLLRYTSFNELYMYYSMIDLFLYVMIPLMICFIPAMVILEEIDDKTSNYLMITPLRTSGYIISRLVYPCIIAFIITIVIGLLCSLEKTSFFNIIILVFLANITALSLIMLIVCLAKNKVEGMAICKISSVLILGIPIPYFITNGYQYLASFLPSFWIAKCAISSNIAYLAFGIIVSLAWIIILYKKFKKKIIY